MTETRFTTGTLHHGDAVEVLKAFPAASVDMIFTDPPYRVISGGKSRAEGYGWGTSVVSKNDGKIFEHNEIHISEYIGELYRVLKPASHLYIMTNNINLLEFLVEIQKVGFGFHNLLVWQKNTAPANRWYMKNLEYVLFFYKRPARKINFPGSKQNFVADNVRDKIHPTQKPLSLMRHYIENSSRGGDVILDPFGGAGSTAIAAIQSNRRWITIEKDPVYAKIARDRLVVQDRIIHDLDDVLGSDLEDIL